MGWQGSSQTYSCWASIFVHCPHRFPFCEGVISKCQENFLKFSYLFLCVCVGVLQSPTAQRCGWWCLWCACRSWLSPSSSLSSSAPWDTTAACRVLRVSDGVAPVSARQSTHHHCSFHNIITNLSLCQLCKRGGADLRRVFVQIIIIKRSAFFWLHRIQNNHFTPTMWLI